MKIIWTEKWSIANGAWQNASKISLSNKSYEEGYKECWGDISIKCLNQPPHLNVLGVWKSILLQWNMKLIYQELQYDVALYQAI